MKNWDKIKLGDLCEVITKGTTPTSIGYNFTDSGIKFIKVESLTESGEIIPNKVAYIDEACHQALKRSQLKKNDILFSIAGALGRIGIVKEDILPANTNQALAIIRLKKDSNALVEFIAKYFNSNIVTDEIEKLRIGAAQQNLSLTQLNNLFVPLPPLPEQQRIISILDEAFAAIAKAKANAEQNLKNAKELFESYLQGVFEKKGDGWEEKIIKEVCELKSGTTISTNLERSEGDVLYVKVGDMTLPENEVEINTSSRFVYRAEIKANQIIPNGAIIFPKRGGAIATNKKRIIIKPTIVDLNTMAIIPGSKIDADYFFHWFQLIDLNSISNGTSIPQINNYSFDDVKIPFPKSKETQQTIVRQLDALRAETQKLEAVYQKKIADLEELKKSILQKAFAGELKTEKAFAV